MKQREILHLIERYAATGHIEDALIPYYNQHGKWQGGTIQWRIPIPNELKQLMSNSKLPSARRVTDGPSGKILHTSYTWRDSEPLTLDYTRIEGSLTVDNVVPIHAPNLQHIGRHLLSPTSAEVEMPHLQSIRGNVDLIHCLKLSAPKLERVGGNLIISSGFPPMLVTVGGRIALYGTQPCVAPSLQSVGQSLVVYNAASVVAPKLQSISGSLLLSHATELIRAPNLVSIGGDFLAPSATEIDMFRLRTVSGLADTHSASRYYHPAIKVAVRWTIARGAKRYWIRRQRALELLRKRGVPYL